MADGGGSSAGAGASSGAAAAGSNAGAGTAAAATSSDAGATAGKSAEASGEGSEAGEVASKEGTKVAEKVGEVIDGKTVTVQEVNEKSTINKDHIEGEVKEEKPIKEEVKKHKYADRLAKEYPERKFETDEDYDNGHEELVNNLIGYRDRGVVANQKLVALFEAEPQIADVVSAMIGGATFRSALARHVAIEDLVPEEGDPDHKAYEENKQKRLEAIEKSNKFNKEFQENLEFSAKSVQDFATENNLKPEEAEKILGEFDDMLKDIFRGKITKETLAKIVKAIKHDEAVMEAKKDGLEEGEIKGKNEKIKAVKEKENPVSDGLPTVKKSGDTVEETEKKPEQVEIIDRIFAGTKKRSNF
jgi:hypothetical protein